MLPSNALMPDSLFEQCSMFELESAVVASSLLLLLNLNESSRIGYVPIVIGNSSVGLLWKIESMQPTICE